MKKAIKAIIWLIVIAVVGFGAYSFFGKKEEAVIEEVRPTVEISKPEVGDITLYTDLIGTIEPAEVVRVYPKIGGDVLEVNFTVGEMVTAGQVLCRINSDALDSLKIQVDSAQIQKNDAALALERTQALFNSGSVSKQALEQAQSAASGAALAYESAKNQYDLQMKYTTVIAPISGVIESKNIEVHDMASPSGEICVISGKEQITINFGAPEKIMKILHIGMEIEIDKADAIYKGTITEIASMTGSDGLYQIKATIQNGDSLTTGSKAKVTVVMDQTINALTVPVDCISYDKGNPFLYVLEGSHAKKVDIESGIYDMEKMEVLAGISPEDDIIVTWSNELSDGAEVMVRGAERVETDQNEETPTETAEQKN